MYLHHASGLIVCVVVVVHRLMMRGPATTTECVVTVLGRTCGGERGLRGELPQTVVREKELLQDVKAASAVTTRGRVTDSCSRAPHWWAVCDGRALGTFDLYVAWQYRVRTSATATAKTAAAAIVVVAVAIRRPLNIMAVRSHASLTPSGVPCFGLWRIFPLLGDGWPLVLLLRLLLHLLLDRDHLLGVAVAWGGAEKHGPGLLEEVAEEAVSGDGDGLWGGGGLLFNDRDVGDTEQTARAAGV